MEIFLLQVAVLVQYLQCILLYNYVIEQEMYTSITKELLAFEYQTFNTVTRNKLIAKLEGVILPEKEKQTHT